MWQSFESVPRDGTPIEAYAPKYQCNIRMQWADMLDSWVGETGHKIRFKESIFSHWRNQETSSPDGMPYRRWDKEKGYFVYS